VLQANAPEFFFGPSAGFTVVDTFYDSLAGEVSLYLFFFLFHFITAKYSLYQIHGAYVDASVYW
jgi:hypothetical protein